MMMMAENSTMEVDDGADATVSMADVQNQAAMQARENQGVLAPQFPPMKESSAERLGEKKDEFRRIKVPQNRLTPLRENWENILKPVVIHLKLLIRMNTKTKSIEMKNGPDTEDPNALQKASDFIGCFLMGFAIQDAIALLRIEDLYVDTFLVTDVKMLHGDHLSRAIGRVAGQDGKTKYAIENSTRTRIVMADTKVHILGSYANIKLAKNAICALILGSPPGKVYNRMRTVSSRMNERH
jgi:RNA-binding protein PNO1|eukprot:Stramenopile-MAST_4_protein_301